MMRTVSLLVGAATTGAVLVGARGRARRTRVPVDPGALGRPLAPTRSARHGATEDPTPGRKAPSWGGALAAPLATIGRAARLVGRRPPDPAADARAGVVVLLVIVAFAVSPVAGSVLIVGVLAVPALRQRRRDAAHDRRVIEELPDVIDLCRIALDGGLTVHHALEAVVAHGSGAVIDELAAALARSARGDRLGDALAEARRLGPSAEGFIDTLVAAERYGASALAGLDRAATEARLVRRRQGEEAARRVPVKMLFPLVLCTLPALGLLTVLPLLARSLPSLAP